MGQNKNLIYAAALSLSLNILTPFIIGDSDPKLAYVLHENSSVVSDWCIIRLLVQGNERAVWVVWFSKLAVREDIRHSEKIRVPTAVLELSSRAETGCTGSAPIDYWIHQFGASHLYSRSYTARVKALEIAWLFAQPPRVHWCTVWTSTFRTQKYLDN